MDYINFPNDIKLPLIGLGTFPLHGSVLHNSIDMASSIGYQLIDTAHLYKNEKECQYKGKLFGDMLCRGGSRPSPTA